MTPLLTLQLVRTDIKGLGGSLLKSLIIGLGGSLLEFFTPLYSEMRVMLRVLCMCVVFKLTKLNFQRIS